jgi:hypothetical protein
MIKLKIEAFDSGLKPLMRYQKPYFQNHEAAIIFSLLALRTQTTGNPIAHVVDETLLDFVDLTAPETACGVLFGVTEGYVAERNRYDETQGVAVGEVVSTAGLVLTLKCFAGLIRKLGKGQVEGFMEYLAPLTITV